MKLRESDASEVEEPINSSQNQTILYRPKEKPVMSGPRVISLIDNYIKKHPVKGLSKKNVSITFFRQPSTKDFLNNYPIIKYNLGASPSSKLKDDVNLQISRIIDKLKAEANSNRLRLNSFYTFIPAAKEWLIRNDQETQTKRGIGLSGFSGSILGIIIMLVYSTISEYNSKKVYSKRKLKEILPIDTYAVIDTSDTRIGNIESNQRYLLHYFNSIDKAFKSLVIKTSGTSSVSDLVSSILMSDEVDFTAEIIDFTDHNELIPYNDEKTKILVLIRLGEILTEEVKSLYAALRVSGYSDECICILDTAK